LHFNSNGGIEKELLGQSLFERLICY